MKNAFKIPLVVDQLGAGDNSLAISFRHVFTIVGDVEEEFDAGLCRLGSLQAQGETLVFGTSEQDIGLLGHPCLPDLLQEIFRRFANNNSLGSLIHSLDVPKDALGALAASYLGGMILSTGEKDSYYSCGVPIHAGWQAVVLFLEEPIEATDLDWRGESVLVEGLRTANEFAVTSALSEVSMAMESDPRYRCLNDYAEKIGGSPVFLARKGAIVGSWFYRSESLSQQLAEQWRAWTEEQGISGRVFCVEPERQGLNFS